MAAGDVEPHGAHRAATREERLAIAAVDIHPQDLAVVPDIHVAVGGVDERIARRIPRLVPREDRDHPGPVRVDAPDRLIRREEDPAVASREMVRANPGTPTTVDSPVPLTLARTISLAPAESIQSSFPVATS
jgi:hypothetical protein